MKKIVCILFGIIAVNYSAVADTLPGGGNGMSVPIGGNSPQPASPFVVSNSAPATLGSAAQQSSGTAAGALNNSFNQHVNPQLGSSVANGNNPTVNVNSTTQPMNMQQPPMAQGVQDSSFNKNDMDAYNKQVMEYNARKRQDAMDKLKPKYNAVPPLGSTVQNMGTQTAAPAAPVAPAVMISYIIARGGQSYATIRFSDGSTIEAKKGERVAGYFVHRVTPDYVTLVKADKKSSGKKEIKLYKVNPIDEGKKQAQQGGANYSYPEQPQTLGTN